MRYSTTSRFDRSFEGFSLDVQETFRKQIQFLIQDIRHPSLRAKKYDEAEDIWQARVTGKIRFYFRIEDDVYWLLNIKKHSK